MKDWLFIRINAEGELEFVVERTEDDDLTFVRSGKGWQLVLDLPRLIVATASVGGWYEMVILIHKDLVDSWTPYRSRRYGGSALRA